MENLLFFLKKGNCPNLNNISKELKTRIETINKSVELVDKSQEFYGSIMNKVFSKTIYDLMLNKLID